MTALQTPLGEPAEEPRHMDILRLATAGSVDDGKSTLIGRLLFDSKAIFEDQLAAVERTSKERGEDYTNLALLTDTEFVTRGDDEPLFEARVRYRTVGDMTCTGAVESTATTVGAVIDEIAVTRITERGQTRADDRTSDSAMEDRKREGYF